MMLPPKWHELIAFHGIEKAGKLTRQPAVEYGKTLKNVSFTLIFILFLSGMGGQPEIAKVKESSSIPVSGYGPEYSVASLRQSRSHFLHSKYAKAKGQPSQQMIANMLHFFPFPANRISELPR